jgi:Flp pilus assembly protein TadG
MLKVRLPRKGRRGAVLPLTAMLVVFLVALIAFAVDLGWIMAVRTQMQSAADSAALAGASQLLDTSYLQGTGTTNTGTATNSAMKNANSQGQAFAAKNSAGGVSLTLAPNDKQVTVGGNTSTVLVNDSGGDIVCGYLANPSDQTQSLTVSTPGVGPYPNSVQVTVHRDGVRNGSLGLFFAPVLGLRNWNLQAKATATYEGNINGFTIHTNGPSTCKLIPFALKCWTWSNAPTDPWYDASQGPGILQQTPATGGTDNFTRSSTGAVTGSDSQPQGDGICETKLFPLSNGNGNGEGGLQPGNFGTVNIGAMTNGTNDLNRVITNGPNAQDLSVYPGGVLQLDPQTQTVTLSGNPGVSAGCKDAVTGIIGQARILPLYSSVSGNGANCTYTIVAFVGVTILDCNLTGSLSSKHITIQPCWCVDPNAVGGGSSGTSWFVVKPLALTR